MQRQTIQIAFAPWGHNCNAYAYLPNDFDASGKTKYPMLWSLHGQGELGNTVADLAKLEAATGSLPNIISRGLFINPATGKEYEMIVIAPQAPTAQGWSFQETQDAYMLPQMEALYPVDTALVGMSGYSSGGQAAYSCLTDSTTFFKGLSFIAPISAAGLTTAEISALVPNELAGKLTIWAMCGTADAFYTPNLGYYNTLVAGKAAGEATFTTIQGGGHWSTQAYDPTHKGANGLNMYDTFLKSQVVVVAPPPPLSLSIVVAPTVTKGTAVTVTFTTSAGVTVGSISGTIQ